MLQLQTSNEPEQKPWERQEGEPLNWFNRFKRFRGLGPKRTVLAALEQERATIKALKSTQKAIVPGSWKAACIKWQWVERALAFDEWKVEKLVQDMFEDLYSGPALAFHRVMELRDMMLVIQNDFNTSRPFLTPDQRIAYYARLTAIMRDIREEMKVFDAPTQRILLRHYAEKEYADPRGLTTQEDFERLRAKVVPHTSLHPHGYATNEGGSYLIKRMGGHEAVSKGLEEEDKRRQHEKELKAGAHGTT